MDAQLARYRSMRDFGVTAEPSGDPGNRASSQALPFVIQKHAATRLHYDFRLGWNGVLKSWAVAKGPSYNVKDKRLAVQVEDHPIEYGGFEGIIPKGQYGGGTVMVWDQGTWEPHNDVDEGLRTGSLKFSLNGTKMHGKWTLIRMGGKAAHESKPNWLLIKEHDALERTPADPCITEEAPDSAVTGRSLQEIAAAETHVWNSKETAGTGQAWYRQSGRETGTAAGQKASSKAPGNAVTKSIAKLPSAASNLPGSLTTALKDLPAESVPDFVKPQLAQEGTAPPTRGEWLHELKLDGYRVQARRQGKTVQLLTRTGLDWTHRMKPVAAALARIPSDRYLLDGEVVVLDQDGLSSFARLQASFEKGESHPLTYFVFDLLHLDGRSTRDLPLVRRKELLRELVGEDTEDLRLSEHIDAPGDAVFQNACDLHAEGIISKKADARYISGRGATWVKSKCLHEQEFVIGGFTDLSNGQRGIGSLLLGYYDSAGKLIYAGRTGTGFTQKTHRTLRDRLEPLARTASPFAVISAEGRRGAHWLSPELVAEVRFSTWTGENQLRHAAYLGLREDKPAREIRRENAAPQPKRDRHADPQTARSEQEKKTSPENGARTPPAAAAQPAAPPLRLTHPAKILDITSSLTKLQLATYLFAVAPQMLPHIAGRPLSLVRCPEGSGKPCFYQKHTNHMLPPGVGSVMVPDKKTGVPEPYITLDTAEALAGLAQMSVLEIHPWGSHNADLEHPDRIIIDLDPDESLPWETLTSAANDVRAHLKKLHLESFVKTTGGKGLHVVFPIMPEHDFETVKTWARNFVLGMERENARLYLSKMTKAARVGKIYLDYLRNERGATAVAPFSMRSRPGVPVSVPLAWKELEAAGRPIFTVPNFDTWRDRLRTDPWKKIGSLRQTLPVGAFTPAAKAKKSA